MLPGGSGSQGGAMQGTVGHLRQKLHALRAAFMASRLAAVEDDVREAQSAASQSAAEAGGAGAGGSTRARGAGGPAAAGGIDGGEGEKRRSVSLSCEGPNMARVWQSSKQKT